MRRLLWLAKKLGKKENGVTAIEYGLLAALIALALFLGAQAVGIALNDIFSGIGGFLNSKASVLP